MLGGHGFLGDTQVGGAKKLVADAYGYIVWDLPAFLPQRTARGAHRAAG